MPHQEKKNMSVFFFIVSPKYAWQHKYIHRKKAETSNWKAPQTPKYEINKLVKTKQQTINKRR